MTLALTYQLTIPDELFALFFRVLAFQRYSPYAGIYKLITINE